MPIKIAHQKNMWQRIMPITTWKAKINQQLHSKVDILTFLNESRLLKVRAYINLGNVKIGTWFNLMVECLIMFRNNPRKVRVFSFYHNIIEGVVNWFTKGLNKAKKKKIISLLLSWELGKTIFLFLKPQPLFLLSSTWFLLNI
jgi:hypothetical protein